MESHSWKRATRAVLVCTAAALLITGGTGCMKRDKDGLTSQERKMLTYVSEKYTGDSFTFEKSFGGVDNAYNCCIRSEQYPEYPITVRLVERKSGDSYTDSYLEIKYAKEIRETAERVLTECFGDDYYMNCEPVAGGESVSPADATSDTTYEEYAADPENDLTLLAIIRYDLSKEGKEKAWEDLKGALEKEGISYSRGYITFETDKDPQDFKTEDIGPYNVQKTYDNRLTFKMEGPGVFTRIEWEK